MEIAYSLAAELLLGIVIGFIINDSPRISGDEIKVSTMVFVVLNLIIALLYPELIPMLLKLFVLGWMVICLGLIIGDYLRLKVVHRIVDSFSWRNLDKDISTLIAHSVDYVKEDTPVQKQRLNAQIQIVINQSNAWLARKEDPELRELVALCIKFAQLSYRIAAEQDAKSRRVLIESWQELSTGLGRLAEPMMRTAAKQLQSELSTIWHFRRTDWSSIQKDRIYRISRPVDASGYVT